MEAPLQIIANSRQQLTMKWGRRLVTMVKTGSYDPADPAQHAVCTMKEEDADIKDFSMKVCF